jgi:hypothetical protein
MTVTDDLERTYKEAVVVYFKHYPTIFLEELKKNTKTVRVEVGPRDDIRTSDLPKS